MTTFWFVEVPGTQVQVRRGGRAGRVLRALRVVARFPLIQSLLQPRSHPNLQHRSGR